MSKEEIKTKVLQGAVVSNKMVKTVTVLIERVKTHPIYKRKFVVSKKYKAHDEEGTAQVGDIVEIIPTRPISRDKHFKILRKI